MLEQVILLSKPKKGNKMKLRTMYRRAKAFLTGKYEIPFGVFDIARSKGTHIISRLIFGAAKGWKVQYVPSKYDQKLSGKLKNTSWEQLTEENFDNNSPNEEELDILVGVGGVETISRSGSRRLRYTKKGK